MNRNGRRDTEQRRIYLDSIGCRLNQSEMELIARQLQGGGAELVDKPEDSDLAILNTCTVTAKAAATSRSQARSLGRAQAKPNVVLTGCWATVEAEKARSLQGVTSVVPNHLKEDIPGLVVGQSGAEFDAEPLARVPLPGARSRTRAFIKAQDGCNHACGYCLTTVARGRSRSLPIEEVVDQVQAAVNGGVREAVLSGVQLSSYGRDLHGHPSLVDLCRAILNDTGIKRLRLSSLEPWGLPDGFFRLWENERMCRQLHLPLQSGCVRTLRRMSRPSTPGSFMDLVQRARSAIPRVAITTDLIFGFPGETEEEAAESLDFVRQIEFSDAHIFPFSARPGTPAAKLADRVDPSRARRRARAARVIVNRSARRYRASFVGETLDVLWESVSGVTRAGFTQSGWSDNYLRVQATATENMWNRISTVTVTGLDEDLLTGTIPAISPLPGSA